MFFLCGINHQSKNELAENRQELVMSASVFFAKRHYGSLEFILI